jgi:hypothetical protein
MEKGIYVWHLSFGKREVSLTVIQSDYRALKKQIAAIRRAQGSPVRVHESPIPSNDVEIYEYPSDKPTPEERIPKVVTLPFKLRDAGVSFISFTSAKSESTAGDDGDDDDDDFDEDEDDDDSCRKPRSLDSSPRDTPPAGTGQTLASPMSSNELSHPVIIADGLSPFHGTRPLSPLPAVLPLPELLPLLSRLEAGFFDILDRELSKVENFYLTQEEKMKNRSQELKEQFVELFEHRVRHVCSQFAHTWHRLYLMSWLIKDTTQPVPGFPWPPALKNITSRLQPEQDTQPRSVMQVRFSTGTIPGTASSKIGVDVPGITTGTKETLPKESPRPEAYLNAERKLKKAVMEHYRWVSMANLHILNISSCWPHCLVRNFAIFSSLQVALSCSDIVFGQCLGDAQ